MACGRGFDSPRIHHTLPRKGLLSTKAPGPQGLAPFFWLHISSMPVDVGARCSGWSDGDDSEKRSFVRV